MTGEGRSPSPPPYPCPGWSDGSTPPEGYTWQWALAHDGWRAGGDGKLCRFTVGPGHTTCRRPAEATLLRGRGGRYGYCAKHLYGRHLHDGAVWSPLLTSSDDASTQTPPTADRGSASLTAIRDVADFATACLLGALILLALLALGADRRCTNDPTLALCGSASTQEDRR